MRKIIKSIEIKQKGGNHNEYANLRLQKNVIKHAGIEFLLFFVCVCLFFFFAKLRIKPICTPFVHTKCDFDTKKHKIKTLSVNSCGNIFNVIDNGNGRFNRVEYSMGAIWFFNQWSLLSWHVLIQSKVKTKKKTCVFVAFYKRCRCIFFEVVFLCVRVFVAFVSFSVCLCVWICVACLFSNEVLKFQWLAP